MLNPRAEYSKDPGLAMAIPWNLGTPEPLGLSKAVGTRIWGFEVYGVGFAIWGGWVLRVCGKFWHDL